MVGLYAAYLGALGVVPAETATYRQACREGWAPAPTNDVQRAIWDRYRAAPAGAAGPRDGGGAAKLEARKPEE